MPWSFDKEKIRSDLNEPTMDKKGEKRKLNSEERKIQE